MFNTTENPRYTRQSSRGKAAKERMVAGKAAPIDPRQLIAEGGNQPQTRRRKASGKIA